MQTVFLYVCAFIIRSFVHSGSIVADREMFDISAILHFCVSNKKILMNHDFVCTEEDTGAVGPLHTCEMGQPREGEHLQSSSRPSTGGPAV